MNQVVSFKVTKATRVANRIWITGCGPLIIVERWLPQLFTSSGSEPSDSIPRWIFLCIPEWKKIY